MATERISVYNIADLKNTTDDAIPNYLNSLKFKQTHRLIDVRLSLGYSAFLTAAVCFAWDYKLGYDRTKYWTAGAVLLYMILSASMTAWMTFVEKGVIYEGVAPSGEAITIATSTKKYDPTYTVTISTPTSTTTFSRSFADWFDEQGRFVTVPFQQMLASAVPLIGVADPKRVVSEKDSAAQIDERGAGALEGASPEVLEAILEASRGVSSGAEEKKGGRRRKA
ncbi:related to signal peptidase 18 KD subunit [Cephalotrichum gorgonifer]|uniref:Signal peptidase complex subunit 2 n=1 Tax=Cephalotrichum gorgonifer TaxID=2041049 RepID=A0AAE8MRG3_9PEZI|nr:related to signal peptidase 18 KD subunit [Cephalotrichum gorgonifer]